MGLFCAGIRIGSTSLLSFPFFSLIQVFSWVNSSVCRLKYPYSCFSSHFCFLVFVVFLFVLMLPMLLLIAVIGLFFFFFFFFAFYDLLFSEFFTRKFE